MILKFDSLGMMANTEWKLDKIPLGMPTRSLLESIN